MAEGDSEKRNQSPRGVSVAGFLSQLSEDGEGSQHKSATRLWEAVGIRCVVTNTHAHVNSLPQVRNSSTQQSELETPRQSSRCLWEYRELRALWQSTGWSRF